MKKLLTLIFLFQFISVGFSQEKTYGGNAEGLLEKRGGLGTLVVIPFEDKMYLSDADAPIGRETGLQPGELMTKFRFAIVESLEKELSKNWNVTTMYESSTQEASFGLEFVHSSIKYQYTAVSGEVLMANDTNISKKDSRKSKNRKKEESGISGGEVVTHSDQREKFMDVQITNDTLLNYLNRNNTSDYYLFLSEFDIRYHVANPDQVASGGLYYRLKVHFSCIDNQGKVLVAGAATSDVQSSTKNIYEIIQKAIPDLTAKLSKMIRKFKTEQR